MEENNSNFDDFEEMMESGRIDGNQREENFDTNVFLDLENSDNAQIVQENEQNGILPSRENNIDNVLEDENSNSILNQNFILGQNLDNDDLERIQEKEDRREKRNKNKKRNKRQSNPEEDKEEEEEKFELELNEDIKNFIDSNLNSCIQKSDLCINKQNIKEHRNDILEPLKVLKVSKKDKEKNQMKKKSDYKIVGEFKYYKKLNYYIIFDIVSKENGDYKSAVTKITKWIVEKKQLKNGEKDLHEMLKDKKNYYRNNVQKILDWISNIPRNLVEVYLPDEYFEPSFFEKLNRLEDDLDRDISRKELLNAKKYIIFQIAKNQLKIEKSKKSRVIKKINSDNNNNNNNNNNYNDNNYNDNDNGNFDSIENKNEEFVEESFDLNDNDLKELEDLHLNFQTRPATKRINNLHKQRSAITLDDDNHLLMSIQKKFDVSKLKNLLNDFMTSSRNEKILSSGHKLVFNDKRCLEHKLANKLSFQLDLEFTIKLEKNLNDSKLKNILGYLMWSDIIPNPMVSPDRLLNCREKCDINDCHMLYWPDRISMMLRKDDESIFSNYNMANQKSKNLHLYMGFHSQRISSDFIASDNIIIQKNNLPCVFNGQNHSLPMEYLTILKCRDFSDLRNNILNNNLTGKKIKPNKSKKANNNNNDDQNMEEEYRQEYKNDYTYYLVKNGKNKDISQFSYIEPTDVFNNEMENNSNKFSISQDIGLSFKSDFEKSYDELYNHYWDKIIMNNGSINVTDNHYKNSLCLNTSGRELYDNMNEIDNNIFKNNNNIFNAQRNGNKNSFIPKLTVGRRNFWTKSYDGNTIPRSFVSIQYNFGIDKDILKRIKSDYKFYTTEDGENYKIAEELNGLNSNIIYINANRNPSSRNNFVWLKTTNKSGKNKNSNKTDLDPSVDKINGFFTKTIELDTICENGISNFYADWILSFFKALETIIWENGKEVCEKTMLMINVDSIKIFGNHNRLSVIHILRKIFDFALLKKSTQINTKKKKNIVDPEDEKMDCDFIIYNIEKIKTTLNPDIQPHIFGEENEIDDSTMIEYLNSDVKRNVLFSQGNTYLMRTMPSTHELWKLFQFFMKSDLSVLFSESSELNKYRSEKIIDSVYNNGNLYDYLLSDQTLKSGNFRNLLEMTKDEKDIYRKETQKNDEDKEYEFKISRRVDDVNQDQYQDQNDFVFFKTDRMFSKNLMMNRIPITNIPTNQNILQYNNQNNNNENQNQNQNNMNNDNNNANVEDLENLDFDNDNDDNNNNNNNNSDQPFEYPLDFEAEPIEMF